MSLRIKKEMQQDFGTEQILSPLVLLLSGAGIMLYGVSLVEQFRTIYGQFASWGLAAWGISTWLLGVVLRSLVSRGKDASSAGNCRSLMLAAGFLGAFMAFASAWFPDGAFGVANIILGVMLPVLIHGYATSVCWSATASFWVLTGAMSGLVLQVWLLRNGLSTGAGFWTGLALLALAAVLACIRPLSLVGLAASSLLALFGISQIVLPTSLPLMSPSIDTRYATAFYRLSSEEHSRALTEWVDGHRIDRVPMQNPGNKAPENKWIYVDGEAPVLVPASTGAHLPGETLRRRYPMIGFLMEAIRPESMLSAGVIPGPEIEIARTLGVHKAVSVSSILDSGHGQDSRIKRRGRFNEPLRHGILRHFQALDKPADLLLLTVPRMRHPWFVETGGMHDVDVTREALLEYWRSLSHDGVLAIAVRDEAIFGRILLTLWQMLDMEADVPLQSAASRVWGYSIDPMSIHKSHAVFLIIAARGGVETIGQHLKDAEKKYPVSQILGPGARASAPYDSFYKVNGVAIAQRTLSRYFWTRDHQRLIFASLSDAGPGISYMPFDLHPWLKGMTIVAAVLGIYMILIPMSDMRGKNSDWDRNNPSVALVMLSCLVAGGLWIIIPATSLRLMELAGASWVISGGLSFVWILSGAFFALLMYARYMPTDSLARISVIGSAAVFLLVFLVAVSWHIAVRLDWYWNAAIQAGAGYGLMAWIIGMIRSLKNLDGRFAGWMLLSTVIGIIAAPGLHVWWQARMGHEIIWAILAGLSVIPLLSAWLNGQSQKVLIADEESQMSHVADHDHIQQNVGN